MSPNIYFCKVVWLVKFRDDSAKQFFQHFCKVYGWRTWILCSIFVAEVMRVEVSLAVVVSLRPKKGRLWASRFHPTQFRVGYTCFVSKPRVSDTWAWHTGALLALCETKGLRQDFPLLQVGKQGFIKVSTPDHSGCKFVHLGPPGILWASSALRLFSNPGPKGLTRKHALPPHISGRQSCNLSKKH